MGLLGLGITDNRVSCRRTCLRWWGGRCPWGKCPTFAGVWEGVDAGAHTRGRSDTHDWVRYRWTTRFIKQPQLLTCSSARLDRVFNLYLSPAISPSLAHLMSAYRRLYYTSPSVHGCRVSYHIISYQKFIVRPSFGLSSKVVNECQVSFGFLPAKIHILIRTAWFLQKLIVSENSQCMLLANDARRKLHNIFLYNLVTIFKPHASYAMLFAKFFDKS